jgi:hypothetical protein
MARMPDGILGGFVGRIGTVTGYIRNGQNIMRISTREKDHVQSPARTNQREKLKLCNEFVKPFVGTGFFTRSFPPYGNTGTGFNRAMGVVLNLGIYGNYPHLTLSYPDVLISKGVLPSAANAAAVVNAEGNIVFSWQNNSNAGTAKPTDKAILLAYFTGLGQIIYSFDTATRADETAILITSQLRGNTAETWLGFLSSDEKDAADSVYTGGVEV